jgi:2-hydroxycyclohexanecarboxyl-CoA dehydrogenase
MKLVGKIALVSGAGSGIGRAIAVTLAQQGAIVVVTDMDELKAKQTATEIEVMGLNAIGLVMNVCDPQQIASVQTTLAQKNIFPNIIVNNAGWTTNQSFIKNPPDLWDRLIDINLMGVIRVTRAFLDPITQNDQGGTIVNVSSDAGRVGSSGESVYAAAKGGVISFSKSLARELARYKINVNCVCPGPTDTALLRTTPEKFQDALLNAIPLKKFADPIDIANAVAFFAAPESAYVTGQVISVSGGLTMAG